VSGSGLVWVRSMVRSSSSSSSSRIRVGFGLRLHGGV
jgi:hypothetical protein